MLMSRDLVYRINEGVVWHNPLYGLLVFLVILVILTFFIDLALVGFGAGRRKLWQTFLRFHLIWFNLRLLV